MREQGEITPVGRIISERTAFDDKFFTVVERVIETPNGEIRQPQFVWDHGKDYSLVVGISEDHHFVLLQEPKYGQMKNFLGVSAGAIKKEETPQNAARREFLEETGYLLEEVIPIKSVPMIDYADKTDGGLHHFYIGFNAKKVSEPEANRKVVLISREQAEKLLDDELDDMKLEVAMSYVALSCALRYLDKS